MTHYGSFILCLAGALSMDSGWAQDSANISDKSSSPVAYVYVTRPTHIDGFAASSSGKLTPVPGSPFIGFVNSLSVNKKFLFGSGDDQQDIYTFSIAPDGALKKVSEINAQKYNPENCGGMGPLQIDYAGKTVYNQVNAPANISGITSCQSVYQSFKIKENGDLDYLASAPSNIPTTVMLSPLSPIALLGTDKFAFQVGCQAPGDIAEGQYPAPITVLDQRQSNGALLQGGQDAEEPGAAPLDIFCAYQVAGDPADHLAIAWLDLNLEGSTVGNPVLVPYTAHGAGNLSTASTLENIPVTGLAYIAAMSISPTGKLLAVGGPGFQLFHFNGPDPITPYSGVLQSGEQFKEFGWDADSHLYALSSNALFVYNVTPTSITETPGSPYSIPEASSVIVLNK